MRRYEVLRAKKLFDGSDVIRAYSYRAAAAGDNYALFWETDCFVCCSPCDRIIGNTADLS